VQTGYAPTNRNYAQAAMVLFAARAAAVVVAATSVVAAPSAQANGGGSTLQQPPSAGGFASLIADSTTAYQQAHGIPARLANVDCVRASFVDYMCSYAVTSPNHLPTCHLMQARWTPNSASLYTVTLAGRLKECGNLREALRSLQGQRRNVVSTLKGEAK
jgi:hypothetical protein